jgi:uncharacterized protein (TIGR02466 family)
VTLPKFVYGKDTALGAGPEPLFVTPLLKRKLERATPEFVGRVKAYVLALEQRDRGLRASNCGGWHSSGDLFETDDQTMQQLRDDLLSLCAEMSYFQVRDTYPDCLVEPTLYGGSWANVSRDGAYNKPHVHPGACWSGVFYVDLGERTTEQRDNGLIEFLDPRAGNVHGSARQVAPEAGSVLVFPSWLCHYVNPFRGRGARISIAFNTKIKISPIATRSDRALPR